MDVVMPQAVRESMAILGRHRALFEPRGRRTMSEADIARVVRVFEEAGAKWALVGAHAVGLLTEPRATSDFDFIVEGTKLAAILEGLRDAFGELDVDDMGAALRLRSIDVDLIRSTNHPLFKRALELTRQVETWSVPRTEVILALKFLAAASPWRDADKRAQDVLDLRRIYRVVGRDKLDLTLTFELGGLAYPGASAELRTLLEKIDRGEPIAI